MAVNRRSSVQDEDSHSEILHERRIELKKLLADTHQEKFPASLDSGDVTYNAHNVSVAAYFFDRPQGKNKKKRQQKFWGFEVKARQNTAREVGWPRGSTELPGAPSASKSSSE